MAELGALWAAASLGVMVWVRECTLLCVCVFVLGGSVHVCVGLVCVRLVGVCGGEMDII